MAQASLLDVKKRIRALLISSKNGCSPKSLYQDYQNVIGEELPFKQLGYRSMMAFITTIPDVVAVRVSQDKRTVLRAVADENTQHISRLVSRQRSSSASSSVYVQPPPRRKAPPRRIPDIFATHLKQLFLCYPNGIPLERFAGAYSQRFGHYVRFQPWGYATLEELLDDAEGAELVRDPLRGSCTVKPRRKRSNLTLQLDRKAVPADSLHALETSPVEKKSFPEGENKSAGETAGEPEKEKQARKPSLPDRLTTNIKELLKANTGGMWLSQFCSLYKDFFGEDLPFFTQGYSSPLHLLSSLPDCCAIERPLVGHGDWLVATVGTSVKVAPNHPYNSCAYVSTELTATIHRMLAATSPEGIPLCSFLASFKDQMGKELEMKGLGFNNLVELLERVEGVEVMKPPGAGFLMVCGPAKKRRGGGGGASSGCDSSESEAPPRPPGSMASGYKPQSVSTDKKMLGVYVTHVHTPSCLCVQLIGENTTRALEYLLEDLTQFYNSPKGDAYQLKKPHIGQPCCALFNNDGYWYRAEVVDLPSSDVTEVLYVDYGNTGKIPTASLRKTKPHYMILPAQAVKCRLAHLKPAGSRWSSQASRLLFQMTKDKPIVAILSAVVEGVISASLCDTTSNEDIHINDILVSQGLAIFMRDTEDEEAKYDGYQPEPAPQGAAETPTLRAPLDCSDCKPSQRSSTHSASSHHSTSTQAAVNPSQPATSSVNPSQSAPSLVNPSAIPLQHTPQPASLQLTSDLPSALNTSLPMSAPPGFPAPPTSQDSTQFMNNYLVNLNRQLFLQQAYLTGLTGATPPPPNINQFLSGFPFPACPVTNTPSQSSVLLPEKSRLTSIPDPVHPVEAPPHPGDKTTPPRHTPTPAASTGEAIAPRKQEKHIISSAPKMIIKKCQLTDECCLHVLRHSNRAYVLSPQVSEWFWDTDQLQSMLRQVHNSRQVWGLLLQNHRVHNLFREMKSDPVLRPLLHGRNEVTVYALEDLPSIVSMFHAPVSLCSAVKMEAEEWLKKGLDYFADPDQELELVTAALRELQAKRQQILASLSEEGEDGNIDEGALELVKVTKSISKLKASRTALLQRNTAATRGNGDRETNNPGAGFGASAGASLPSSEMVRERGGSTSQASGYGDSSFYSCPSTVSELTPSPSSPVTAASSEIFPASYTESAPVLPSSFNKSSSSSLSSLSDSAIFIPPLNSKEATVKRGASERATDLPSYCNSDKPGERRKEISPPQTLAREAEWSEIEPEASSNHTTSPPWTEECSNEKRLVEGDGLQQRSSEPAQATGKRSPLIKWPPRREQRSYTGAGPSAFSTSTVHYMCTNQTKSSDPSPSTGQNHHREGEWRPQTQVGRADSKPGAVGGSSFSGSFTGRGGSGQDRWQLSSPRKRRVMRRGRPSSHGSGPSHVGESDSLSGLVPNWKLMTGCSNYVLQPPDTVDLSSSSGFSSPTDLAPDFKKFASNSCPPTTSKSRTPTSQTPVPQTPTSETRVSRAASVSLTPTPSLLGARRTPTGTSSPCSVRQGEEEGDCLEEDIESGCNIESGGGSDRSEVKPGTNAGKSQESKKEEEKEEEEEEEEEGGFERENKGGGCERENEEKSKKSDCVSEKCGAIEEMTKRELLQKEEEEDDRDETLLKVEGVDDAACKEVEGMMDEGGDERAEVAEGKLVMMDEGGEEKVEVAEGRLVDVDEEEVVAEEPSCSVEEVVSEPQRPVELSGLEEWCRQMELKDRPQLQGDIQQSLATQEDSTQGKRDTSEEPATALLVDISSVSPEKCGVDEVEVGVHEVGSSAKEEEEEVLVVIDGGSIEAQCSKLPSETGMNDTVEEERCADGATSRDEQGINISTSPSPVADNNREAKDDGTSTPPPPPPPSSLTSPTMARLGENKVSDSPHPCISWISPPPKTRLPTELTASRKPVRSFRSQMPVQKPQSAMPAGPSSSPWPRPPCPTPSQPASTPASSTPMNSTPKDSSVKPSPLPSPPSLPRPLPPSQPSTLSIAPSFTPIYPLSSPLPAIPRAFHFPPPSSSAPPPFSPVISQPPPNITRPASLSRPHLPLSLPPAPFPSPLLPLPVSDPPSLPFPSLNPLVQVEPYGPRTPLYVPQGMLVEWKDNHPVRLEQRNNQRPFLLPTFPMQPTPHDSFSPPLRAAYVTPSTTTWQYITPQPEKY